MARRKDIFIDQGSVFTLTVNAEYANGEPIVLSTYTSRGTIKKHYGSANSILFTANVTDANTGEVTFTLTSNTLLETSPGRYVYDCEIIDSSNNVTRIAEGIALIRPSVSSLC